MVYLAENFLYMYRYIYVVLGTLKSLLQLILTDTICWNSLLNLHCWSLSRLAPSTERICSDCTRLSCIGSPWESLSCSDGTRLSCIGSPWGKPLLLWRHPPLLHRESLGKPLLASVLSCLAASHGAISAPTPYRHCGNGLLKPALFQLMD